MDVICGWAIKANYTVVQEFNDNTTETKFFGDLLVLIGGKQVHFDPARINTYNFLPDADNEFHKAREREVGQDWFVTHFHGFHRPKWIEDNHWIDSL